MNDAHTSRTKAILKGFQSAVPIIMGYIPVGFAFGVLAQKAGISSANIMLMSLLVFAGASQFIAVGLISAGAPALSIIITTFIVNLRHLIMTSALAPFLNGWKKSELAAFSFQVTDETFAVHSTMLGSDEVTRTQVFATNIASHASWLTGTLLGAAAGSLVADVEPFALDYALPALFIALLVFQIKRPVQVIVAIFSGIVAVLLLNAGLDRWSIIIATLAGATLGVVTEQWNRMKSC